MSSPIPPDPYIALGVSKDAELSTIRTAHRKLVLKYHPDRIKDEAEKEKGKHEFQKIQQAYELLSDSVKRSRYDDQIKLAELRKEAMLRDPAPRTPTYTSRHGPPPTPKSASREFRDDGRFYEERVPSGASPSYFDNKDRFDEPLRTSSRKHPEYERKTSSSKSTEKERKTSTNSGFFAAATAASFGMKMKREVEKTKAKNRERENHAAKKEVRDREKRRDRDERDNRKSPYVVDATDSDSDTATRVTSSTIRPSRSDQRFRPDPESDSPRKRYSAPTRRLSDDDDSDYDNKWERLHETSMKYIGQASSRPVYERTGSDVYDYWGGKSGGSGRKSGSDSDRRPTSSKGRHSYEDIPIRPHLPTQSSAPSNLRPLVEERVPSSQRRSATGSYSKRDRERDRERDRDRDRDADREQKAEMPGFHRSKTMPSPRTSSKRDNAPSKSSNLKHAENQDSGYGSNSTPPTPEMRGDSPVRGSRSAQTSTKYHIVEPDNDNEYRRGPRVNRVLDDEADRHRRYQSPETERREPDRRDMDRREPDRRDSDRREPDRRDSDRREPERRDSDRRREKSDRPERPRADGHIRTRSNRESPSMQDTPVPPPTRRTESARYDLRTSRGSPPLSRNNSGRDKLFGEMSDEDKEIPRHSRHQSSEKISTAPRYTDLKFTNQRRGSSDQRGHDYAQGSRFQDNLRYPEMGSRRGSVY